MSKTIKIETHMHTSEVSRCGKVPAGDMVARFAQAGYGATVVTDHLWADWKAELSPERRVDAYLSGYRAAAEAGAKLGLVVIPGAELRLASGEEDFLAFGLTEADYGWLIALMDTRPTLRGLHEVLTSRNILLVQAHPFRPALRAMPLSMLDGVEVYNGNPRHDSHNDRALAYAERADMIETSGSDAHQPEDVARGGILGPDSIRDGRALVQLLRNVRRPARIETV